MASRPDSKGSTDDARSIQFLLDGPRIPLDLIRSRDAGEVVFIVGAGVSKGSGLPLFKELTRDTFFELTGLDPGAADQVTRSVFKAYNANSFDFVLGYLERRMDGEQPDRKRPRQVRQAIAQSLAAPTSAPIDRHSSLIILAQDQRGEPRVVTTNFDTLLERAWQASAGSGPLISRAGADLPGPGTTDFSGVLHLHGRLSDVDLSTEITATDLVLTDADFGDAYLRSGWAARFLYDLVRRYTLVLVGYGAEDPPLKYLLSVIGADRSRFSDLRPIYAFAHSDASEADDVTGEWLAKGVNPLLYDPGNEHAHLYDSLAEWGRYVDDPTSWADSKFKAIGSRHYDALENHERSILELLLMLPANCGRAKAAGASFSLIRAIEASRPPVVFHNDQPDRFQGPADGYLNPLIAWLWSSLDSLDAAAWAIARQAPRNRVSLSKNDDLSSDEKDEPRQLTEVRGFSVEEISIIRRHYRHNYKEWSRDFAVFWHLLLTSWESLDQNQPEMAYDILQRLQRFNDDPLLGDAKELAEFMTPTLQVSQPIRWEAENKKVDRPLQLADFRRHWNKHPDHKEISEALPDNLPWLVYFLSCLEQEIAELYVLTLQTDGPFGLSWLSTSCHSVASDPVIGTDIIAKNDGWDDPDHYHLDHVPLIRLTSSAWRRMRNIDKVAAKQAATRWANRQERIFVRLHLWSINDPEIWSPNEVGQALENVPDECFWRPDPELVLALVHRWKSLLPEARLRLERRILNHPGIDDSDQDRAEQLKRWYRNTSASILSAIVKSGNILSENASEFLEQYRESGNEPQGLTALVSRGPRVVSIPPTEVGPLADLEGDALIAALSADLESEEYDGGSRATAAISADPGKALQALVATSPRSTGKLWRRLYGYYALSQPAAGITSEVRSTLLLAIQEASPDILKEAVHAAADWMEKIIVGPDEAVMPFLAERQGAIFSSWRHLAQYAFRVGEGERFSSNQGERLMSQALNRAAGVLAFTGIALADRGLRHPTEFPLLAENREEIDHMLCAAGSQNRILVAARVSQWLGTCENLLPISAENLVIKPLLGSDPDLVLLDLHLLYGRGMTESQYERLEPLLLREARNSRLSAQGNQRNVANLVWRTLDRFAGLHDQAPAHTELRSILQRTTVETRTSVARVCRNWFLKRDIGERAQLWGQVGEPFFRMIWPLDAALRHPAVSQELLRLPAAMGENFGRAVDKITTLTVPFQLYDISSLFVALSDGAEYSRIKIIALPFVADHWSAFLDMLDAAIGFSPSTIPHDLSEWLEDLEKRNPHAQSDPRYRRLLRLTQQ